MRESKVYYHLHRARHYTVALAVSVQNIQNVILRAEIAAESIEVDIVQRRSNKDRTADVAGDTSLGLLLHIVNTRVIHFSLNLVRKSIVTHHIVKN